METDMSQRSENKLSSSVDEDLSSLMDGELNAGDVGKACARWREDPDARGSWHLYQLIGDVLRSEDLASPLQRDQAFLSALQRRLEKEPVVLAPSPAVAHERSPRRTWTGAAAVAAGFAAVAGVLVVTQMSGSSPDPQTYASAPSVDRLSSPVQAVNLQAASGIEASAVNAQVIVPNGQLIRDVRLDEYLAAHKKFGGSSALGSPSGFLRNAAVTDDNSR
ncbi:MAG TPA: sigma-E factor negative regulatory protein [Rhizobacter sp.]|nr:sigma-E factor negative regulatory protein [Rhizobacter sp.]